LNRVPSFGDKLIIAFTRRCELLSKMGTIGLRMLSPGRCRDTNTVRDFLYKNFVPSTWFDTETEAGRQTFATVGSSRETLDEERDTRPEDAADWPVRKVIVREAKA
jgi:hypothetical protein